MGLEITNELKARLSVLQKALRSANNALQDSQELEQRLSEARSALRTISSKAFEEVSPKELKSAFAELGIPELYESIAKKLAGISRISRANLDEFLLHAPLLKRYNVCNTFNFSSEKHALEFVQKIYSLYSIAHANFKPEFLGLLDMDALARETGSRKEGKTLLRCGVSSLPRLFSALLRQGMAKNYTLTSPGLKVYCRSATEICIDAPEARLNRIERLYKEQFATISRH